MRTGTRPAAKRAAKARRTPSASKPSRPAGIDELFADLAALDAGPLVARPASGGRGRDGKAITDRRREAPSAEEPAARTGHPCVGEARGARDGNDHPTADHDRIDPEERAFLLQIYRKLVGGVEGPVIPFPVELVVGEDEAPELDRPADVIDLAWYRTRRALRES